ncbi:MAG: hypothetical protein ABIT76_06355 [Chthoniobacterales bacterium]
MSVGIIGLGMVGGAMWRGFCSLSREVCGYDIDPTRSPDSLEKTLAQDVVFIAVPSPVDAAGVCDLSAIRSVLAQAAEQQIPGSIVLRSTVPVGTTDAFLAAFPTLRLGFSPEFLRSERADADFLHPVLTVYGGDHANAFFQAMDSLCDSPATRIILTTREAELVKLFLNSFATVKAVFASQLAQFAESRGLDWTRVIAAAQHDPRVGHGYLSSHGPDGLPGVGGHCLPKDGRMLMNQLAPGSLLEAALDINARLRASSSL